MSFLKGKVINHSDIELWVIESTTNHPHGPPIAHKLKPNKKSPKDIDADGFKRLDGKDIEGHKDWWKIYSLSSADIYNDKEELRVDVARKMKVKDQHFGDYIKDERNDWGEPIKLITAIYKDRNRRAIAYEVGGLGRIDRKAAISMAKNSDLDNALLVTRGKTVYLRSRPDEGSGNNFKEIIET